MTCNSECIREIREKDGVAVIVLSGELDLHRAPDVHLTLAEVCRNQPLRLVVNLELVTHMDSSGLGTLVEVFRRVRGYGGAMALCGLPERVRGLFEITRLDSLFTIYTSEAEALTG